MERKNDRNAKVRSGNDLINTFKKFSLEEKEVVATGEVFFMCILNVFTF